MFQLRPINLLKIIGFFINSEVNDMKINETGRIGGVNPYQRNIDTRDNHVDKRKFQKDQVSISSEAKEMLEADIQVHDPKRAERIQELKGAVSSGTYHVESGKLAEKLAPYFKTSVQSGEQP